jgi:hypothetical protein
MVEILEKILTCHASVFLSGHPGEFLNLPKIVRSLNAPHH